MNINKSLEEVSSLITRLSLIRDNIASVSVEEAIELYARVFDLLLKDSEHSGNIFNAIVYSSEPSEVQQYVQTLKSLNTMINGLDSAHPLKETLQERLLDNVNLTSITKFEKNYSTNPRAASEAFISENKYPNVVNTVEVRTWGTEREYSNGLRNVVDQKLRQDDAGHAAVVMRVAADEEGLRLIRQYCMDDEGKVIIPHELKKIGNQVVYEIYWSYWPGILHNMEQDYEHERRGLEYRDIKELDRNVPRELSDKYIIHKYRKGKVVSFAAAAERVTADSTQKISSERSSFLDLKEREIKLEEEIETLEVMLENYLDTGKRYCPSELFTDEEIAVNSNFYEILSRFKYQLQPRRVAAKILYNKTISTDDAAELKRAFESLIKIRRGDIEKTKAQIEAIAPEIQLSYERSQALTEKISKEAKETSLLKKIIGQKEEVSKLKEASQKLLQKGEYPITLSEEMMAWMSRQAERFILLIEHPIHDILCSGQIERDEDLLKIIEECQNYETELAEKIAALERDPVRNLIMEQVAIFRNEREHAQTYIRQKASNIEQSIATLRKQIEELNAIIPTLPAVSPLDDIREINQLGRDVNSLDKLSKNFVGERDFTYKLDGENITVKLESVEDVIGLKQKIAIIYTERKEDIPELREQLRKGEKSIDRDGASPVVRSLYEATKARDTAQKELSELLTEQQSLQRKLQLAKIRPTTHMSEIAQKQIRRGYPYKFSMLAGFNIEEMLKIARPLAGTVTDFRLKVENCSTTSMKLLRAGSPDFKKGMFVESKPPVVVTPYQLEIKPDYPDAKFKPNTIYLKQIDGRIAYSLLGKNGLIQQDIILDITAPGTFDLKSLERFRPLILKDIVTKGFSADLEYDSETFLTNPQAVYTAARVYERAAAGDRQAMEVAKRMLDPRSRNETYYRLINKLASKSDEDLSQLRKNPRSILSLIWEFIKHPTALFQLYKDYKKPIKEQNSELVAVESQLRDIESAIRGLSSDNKYIYIGLGTPAVAINKMLKILNSSPDAIPFFTKDKLAEVENYICGIAQKDTLSDEDKAILRAFDNIVGERDNRIKAVEKALANGRDVKTQLANNASNSKIKKLIFPFSERDLDEHRLYIFIQKYTQERDKQLFAFARHNFVKTLRKLKTVEEKLAAIVKHIEENTASRSAKVWKIYIENDPVLISVKKSRENKRTRVRGLSSETLHSVFEVRKEEAMTDLSPEVIERHATGRGDVRVEHEASPLKKKKPVTKMGLKFYSK